MKSRKKYRESRSRLRQFLLKIGKKLRIRFTQKLIHVITLQSLAMIEVEEGRLVRKRSDLSSELELVHTRSIE